MPLMKLPGIFCILCIFALLFDLTVCVTPRASYGHSEQQGSANQNRITLDTRESAFSTYTLNILGAVHARGTGKGCTRPRFFSDQGKRRDCTTKPAHRV